MKIYLNSSSEGVQSKKFELQKIIRQIENNGHDVSLKWIKYSTKYLDQSIAKQPQPRSINIFKENLAALTKSDACIFDISIISWGVVYQSAIALSKNIPTLCLYDGSCRDKNLSHMLTGMQSKYLHLKKYDEDNLEKIVKMFIRKVEVSSLVKFNFIATKEIKDYIEWAAGRRNISKSELLREFLTKKMIEKDDKYKKMIF